MQVRLNRLELLGELVPMQGIVERRTTIPVLSHILLRAGDNRLEMAATDLEVSLTSWCAAEIEGDGAIAIQAKKLLEIVRACDGDELTFESDDEGAISIRAGRSRFKIRGLPAEDFPTLPAIQEADLVTLPFPIFKAMAGKIFFAISSEESRFQLSGALLKQNDGVLVLVATDGHRLALVESSVDDLEAGDGVLVPRKALMELMRFEDDGDLEFRRGEHHLSFLVGRRRLICRVLEGTFPDYERVISRDNDKHIVLDRQQLQGVIQRVSLLTGDRSRAVRFELQTGSLVLSAANPDLGEAKEDIACEFEGETFSVGVNPDYLRDFLGVVGTDTVRLELKDENSQIVAYPIDGQDERYVCVVMPIRI